MPENCNLQDVEHIRKFVDIPVVCAGRMDPYVAAEAVEANKIDGAGFARQFLADQQWVTKLMEDREEAIIRSYTRNQMCLEEHSSRQVQSRIRAN